MARRTRLPYTPINKTPPANFDPNTPTTRVTSRSNTGVSQSATQTTGATGSVVNRISATSSQGAAGAPGTARVNYPGPTTTGTPSAPVAAPSAASATATVSDARARGGQALDAASAQLAEHRARTLAQLKAAGVGGDAEARVNAAFDEVDKRVKEAHKRVVGD